MTNFSVNEVALVNSLVLARPFKRASYGQPRQPIDLLHTQAVSFSLCHTRLTVVSSRWESVAGRQINARFTDTTEEKAEKPPPPPDPSRNSQVRCIPRVASESERIPRGRPHAPNAPVPKPDQVWGGCFPP